MLGVDVGSMLEAEGDAEAPVDTFADDIGAEPEGDLVGSDGGEVEVDSAADSVPVAASLDVLVVTAIELLDNQSGFDPLRPKYTDQASAPPPLIQRIISKVMPIEEEGNEQLSLGQPGQGESHSSSVVISACSGTAFPHRQSSF